MRYRRIYIMCCVVVAGIGCCLLALAATKAKPSQKTLTTALVAAIRKGDTAAVTRLLKAGASPNRPEIVLTKPSLEENEPGNEEVDGDTPLMIASEEGNRRIVELLISKGANVNGRGDADYTPLMSAVRSRHADIARILLAHRAKPDLGNCFGDTALAFAANEGDIGMVRLLLENGADINGGKGDTPLMMAMYTGSMDVVRLLLQKGANPNLRRERKIMNALEYAEDQGRTDIAAILRKAGAKGRSRAVVKKELDKATAEWEKEHQKDQQKHQLPTEPQTLTQDDRAVIELVLLDMLTRPGEELIVDEPKASHILLINRTAGGEFLTMDDQLNGELDDRKANDISLGIRRDLARRNWEPISLSEFRPSSDKIILRGEDAASNRILDFESNNPDASRWVQVKLPGYSKNRDKAVLRFYVGPSPHGASGTYFLVKKGGVWLVKWREFAFYV